MARVTIRQNVALGTPRVAATTATFGHPGLNAKNLVNNEPNEPFVVPTGLSLPK